MLHFVWFVDMATAFTTEMFAYMRSVCDAISVVIFIFINCFILLYFLKKLLAYFGNAGATKKGGHVLVTGCDSGFGYFTAIELSKRETHVFAGCLTQDGVDRFAGDSSFNGTAFIMDVTKEADIDNARKMIEDVVKDKGLWAVVNNAGTAKLGLIEWQSVEEMQRVMDVNLWGVVKVTKAFIPLVKRSRGRIVNITSMGGRTLLINGTSYSMSKFAAEAFSDGLRFELKPWNVSVHIVEPGFFRTNLTEYANLRKGWEDNWNRQSDEVKQAYGEEYFNDTFKITKEMLDMLASPRTEKVSNAVCHACLSSSPKPRYPVGVDAHTIWMAGATLPTTLGDMLTNLLVKQVKPAGAK